MTPEISTAGRRPGDRRARQRRGDLLVQGAEPTRPQLDRVTQREKGSGDLPEPFKTWGHWAHLDPNTQTTKTFPALALPAVLPPGERL